MLEEAYSPKGIPIVSFVMKMCDHLIKITLDGEYLMKSQTWEWTGLTKIEVSIATGNSLFNVP